MTAQPADPRPDDPRAQALDDAEDDAAAAAWKARDEAGVTEFVPHDEVRRRLGLPG